jgi:hypothetical protein
VVAKIAGIREAPKTSGCGKRHSTVAVSGSFSPSAFELIFPASETHARVNPANLLN